MTTSLLPQTASGVETLVMIFTGVMTLVGIVQAVLFFTQLRLMKKSVEDSGAAAEAARKAAVAAEMNARAAIGMELPIVRLRPVDLLSTSGPIPDSGPYGGIVSDGPPTRFGAIGGLEFENRGRTPAFPTTLAVGWTVAAELPPEPSYPKAVKLSHAAVLMPAGEFYADQHIGLSLTEERIKATADGTAFLWFYGCLRYRDFMNETREARFCFRYAQRDPGGAFYFASDGVPPNAYTLGK